MPSAGNGVGVAGEPVGEGRAEPAEEAEGREDDGGSDEQRSRGMEERSGGGVSLSKNAPQRNRRL